MAGADDCDRSVEGADLFVQWKAANGTTLTGRASHDALGDLRTHLGMTRDDVRSVLLGALGRCAPGEFEPLYVSEPKPLAKAPNAFGRYHITREGESMTFGFVWLDTELGIAGPAEATARVRQRMRVMVQRLFVARSPNAPLLNALLRWGASVHPEEDAPTPIPDDSSDGRK